VTPEEKEQRRKEKERKQQIDADVFRMYMEQRPRFGPEMTAFISRNAEYYDVDEKVIVTAVSIAQRSHLQNQIKASQSVMQRQMELLPDITMKALQTIYRNLDAKERVPIRGTRGDVKTDENGNVLFIEKENHRAQLEAADIVMKIAAGYAPKQVEIESHNTHEYRTTSDDDLLNSFRRIFNIRGIEAQIKSLPAGTPAGGRIVESAGDGGSREECVLLVDSDNGDS